MKAWQIRQKLAQQSQEEREKPICDPCQQREVHPIGFRPDPVLPIVVDNGEVKIVQVFGNSEFMKAKNLPQLVLIERMLPNGQLVVEYMRRYPDGGLGAVRD